MMPTYAEGWLLAFPKLTYLWGPWWLKRGGGPIML